MRKYVINEDFSSYPLGPFPYDTSHSAKGEYHYFEPSGYKGIFYDPIKNHQWRSCGESFLIREINKKRYLMQNRGPTSSQGAFANLANVLVVEDLFLKEFTLEIGLILLNLKSFAGVAFSYHTARDYYAFILEDQFAKIIRVGNENELIKEVVFPTKANELYRIRIKATRKTVLIIVNEKELMKVNLDLGYESIALLAKEYALFSDFSCYLDEFEYERYLLHSVNEAALIQRKKEKYPPLKEVSHFSLPFKPSRNIRFSTNGFKPIMIIPTFSGLCFRDSNPVIRGLGAFDMEGKLIWSFGDISDNDDYLISCDLPLQVSDIDHCGHDEVIFAYDSKVFVMDATTGLLKERINLPEMRAYEPDYPFFRLNPDALNTAFLQFSKHDAIIVKDRYKNVFALNIDGQILWHYKHKNTGHFPLVYDFNNDLLDELLIGYDLVDNKGNILNSLPMNSDHTDEILPFITEDKKYLLLASGNEGFNVCDIENNLIKSIKVGHAQRISLAPLKGDSSYQIAVITFWGEANILTLFDEKFQVIKTKELPYSGSLLTPVRYDGEHILLLLNTHKKSGLCDIDLDIMVDGLFNDDVLFNYVCDLDKDGIDEILTFIGKEVIIHKSSKTLKVGPQYETYKESKASNYRGEYLIRKK